MSRGPSEGDRVMPARIAALSRRRVLAAPLAALLARWATDAASARADEATCSGAVCSCACDDIACFLLAWGQGGDGDVQFLATKQESMAYIQLCQWPGL